MKRFSMANLGTWAAVGGLTLLPCAAQAADRPDAPAGSPAITATAAISENHPHIDAALSCVDCHEIQLDAHTTATEVWLRGDYLKYASGEGRLNPEQIMQAVTDITGGRKHNRTMVLATCINNAPLSTTAEFCLDPQTMTLYGLHEKGTAKLLHIRQNPRVSLNWHRAFTSWDDIQCIQFIGQAQLVEGTDPVFEKTLRECYPYEEMARSMGLQLAQARAMIAKGMVLSKITLTEITINNSAFEKQGFRKYQRWCRTPGTTRGRDTDAH